IMLQQYLQHLFFCTLSKQFTLIKHPDILHKNVAVLRRLTAYRYEVVALLRQLTTNNGQKMSDYFTLHFV
ncbi:MAG: hypothetical protein KDF59_05995, partial [Nitrosomonas sp.]|nr:hypothetical protein [Nitrosomonas sp.]